MRIIAEYLSPELLCKKILPFLEATVKERSEDLRSKSPLTTVAAAESILSIASTVSTSPEKDSLISLFEQLLNDKSVNVRVNIFKTFHELSSV